MPNRQEQGEAWPEVERRFCAQHAGNLERFEGIESKLEIKTSALETMIKGRFNIIMWVIGGIGFLNLFALGILIGMVSVHNSTIAGVEARQVLVIKQLDRLETKVNDQDKRMDDMERKGR